MKIKRLVYQWDENPLLPMLVLTSTGILIANNLPDFLEPFTAITIALGATLFFLKQRSLLPIHLAGLCRTVFASMMFVWMGLCLVKIQHKNQLPSENSAFSCVVIESFGLQEGGKLRCLAVVDHLRTSGHWTGVKARVLLHFSGIKKDFQNGDRLLVSQHLDDIEKPGIPGQFDAAAYYGRQGIHHQVFVKKGRFTPILPAKPNVLRRVSQQSRAFLEKTLAANLPEKEDGYMLSALLLGIRRKIDPELKAAYSAAGVTHILAVSGMHVGLIFGCLVFVFGWIRRWKSGALFFSILIILLLWFYALVTGLSPSVLRAVTVFSVMQLNDLFKKPPLAINGLCFATLILLCADTNLIYDVGYQLSFAAVYGIVSFEKPIRQCWKPRNLLLKKTWEGITITLAATLATFPVILYYFHQFPVYFLIANVVAVPVSNGLIYAGIALLICTPVPALAKWIGWGIHWAIAFLNQFVLFIQHLPFSSIGDVYMPLFALVFLFIALILLNLWLQYAWFPFLRACLSILLVCCLSVFAQNLWMWQSTREDFVIRTKKEWMLGEMQGRSARLCLLVSAQAKTDESFEVKALKEGFGVMAVTSEALPGRVVSRDKKHAERQSFLLVRKTKTYLFLGNYLKCPNHVPKMKIEAMVVLSGGFKTIENALLGYAPKEIWVDWPLQQEIRWKQHHNGTGPVVVNYRSARFRKL